VARDKSLANHMGLFLQKTNIIRDYLVSRGGAGAQLAVVCLADAFWVLNSLPSLARLGS